MKRYQAATPRAAMMVVAIAMSAITLGLSVLPAILGSVEPEARLGVAGGAKGRRRQRRPASPAPR